MSTSSNPAKLSFLIYHEWRIFFEELTPEEQGRLFMALMDYSEFGALPEFTGVLRMAFRIIRQAMDRNEAKWQQTCASRAQAGRKSAAVRAAKKFASEVSCENDSKENEDTAQQQAAPVNSLPQSPTKGTEPEYENEYESERENEYEYERDHGNDPGPENKYKAKAKVNGPSPPKRKTRMYPCETGKAMV